MQYRFSLLRAMVCWSCALPFPARAATPPSRQFIASLWPEAQAAGVSRATFDTETRGLEPDYKLPDLILPGRPATGAPSQAEFVQVPADYIKEASIARLAAEGQRLMAKYRAVARRRSRRASACPQPSCSRSGAAKPISAATRCLTTALRVLATQAYVGRRKDQYRNEFILALKMIGDGEVTRKDMRSSWAGATGLTQFLPSEFYQHGVDFDGDGRVDIWHSVPDALASAAQQLVNKGWQSGVRWAYEVQRARQCRLHHGRAGGDKADRRMAARGLCAGARTEAQRDRAGAAGLAAAARGHLRPGVPDHEELLRHQGI